MRRVLVEKAFKRDLKRLQKRGWRFGVLHHYIELLRSREELPLQARPHKLSGVYGDFGNVTLGMTGYSSTILLPIASFSFAPVPKPIYLNSFNFRCQV